MLVMAVLCAGGLVLAAPTNATAQESSESSAQASTSGSSSAGTAIGSSKKIGVGLGGGTLVNGVSGKFYLSESSAIKALAGLTFNGFGGEVHYMIKELQLSKFGFGRLDLGLGVGAAFRTFNYSWGNYMTVGPNANIGFQLKFNQVPLEITASWRPGYYFALSSFSGRTVGGLGLGGGGGAIRWYF
jgi:hypothetical protein